MSYFQIKLIDPRAVELVLDALRYKSQHKGCIASSDLAAGIEIHTLYIDEEMQVAVPLPFLPEYMQGKEKTAEPTRPHLRLVPPKTTH